MARILMIGHNTPQFLGDSKIEAAHYRTWQFLDQLLADGHTVCLCAAAFPANSQPSSPPDELITIGSGASQEVSSG